MSVIVCKQNKQLREQIERFSEALKTEAHKLGDHGLDEREFYNSGLFRGAVERVRGQFSATMRGKREFAQHALNHMEDGGFIAGWESTEGGNRNDYSVRLNSGRTAVIDLKGCLDGNHATIFERPATADEFVIWSVCSNPGADPRRNAWSGIHTRLSAEMISRNQRVDGVVMWEGRSAGPVQSFLRRWGEPPILVHSEPRRLASIFCLRRFPQSPIPMFSPRSFQT